MAINIVRSTIFEKKMMPKKMRANTGRRFTVGRVEILEARRLLSAKPPAQVEFEEMPSTIDSGATELVITGTKKNDGIVINDNGTGTAGNIFVSLSNGTDYMSVNAITDIFVLTGTGKDSVTYELDGNLQPNVQRHVFVGSGAKNGGGTVDFTADVVGKTLAQSGLAVIGIADAKKPTTMTLNDSGDIDGSLTAGLETAKFGTSHKAGPEILNLSSTAQISSDGTLVAGLIGTARNDVANVSYTGTNDGEIDVTEKGNGGADRLAANIFMTSTSSGKVGGSTPAEVTGSGKDHLDFTIDRGADSTSMTGINAYIVGTSKKDKLVHTANVIATTKGSNSTVS